MSNKIALATIQFKADAKGANAALESMRQSAKETEQKVADLQRAFDNGVKTMKDANGVEFNVAEELKRAKAEATSFNDGIAQLIKGATALEAVVKNIRLGEIEKNTRGELKGALNALDMRRRNLKEESPDYAERKKDFDDAEAEIKKQINRIDHDTDRLLKTLSEGGSVAKEVIDKEMKGLEDMLKLIPETTEEWKKYAAQLKEIRGYVDEMNKQELKQTASILGDQNLGQYNETQIREAIKAGEQLIKTYETANPEAKRLAEEIVRAEEHLEQYGTKAERAARREAKAVEDAAERRRKSDEMMQQQLQKGTNLTESALKQQEQYWRKLIDDPKTAAESLQQYEANLAHVKSLQEQMASDAIRTKGEEALSFFRGDTSNASADTVQTQAKALKAYRDSLPQHTDASVIQEINSYIAQSGEVAKIAAGEAMTLDEALRVSSTAGKEGFKGTQKQLEQAEQALQKAVENTKKGSSKWKEYKAALSAVRLEMDNASMTSERMHAILGNPRSAKNIDELRNAVKRADAELRHMSDTVGTNNTQYEKLASSTKKAKQELKRMEEQSSASGTAFEKAISRLKTYVGVYVSAAVAMQKIIGTMGDLLALSDKMGEVRKTTGFTAEQVGRLSDSLAKLDTRTGLTGLMEFSSLAGSIGLKTQEAVEGFTKAANMIAVSLPEMGNEASRTLMKIADATGDLKRNGGDVEETLQRVGSTIIALRANSAAAAGPITDFISRVGAVGAQAGISIDQIAALGATVDALGGRVEMSATALSRMIPAIRNNTFEVAQAIGMTEKELNGMDAMQQMVAIFKALRDSAKGFDTSTEQGMNAMADSVEKALGRSTSMQEVMKELNQQGARAGIVFGLLSQNVDKLEEQLGTAANAYQKNTALMDEYNKMNDTAAAKWERLKNQVEEMYVSDSAQRFLGGIIDGLRWIVDFISGNVHPALNLVSEGLKTIILAWSVFKIGLGEGIFVKLVAGYKSLKDSIILVGMYTKQYIALQWQLVFAHNAEEKAAIKAKMATAGLNKEMRANIFMAVAAAVLYLGYKIYDWTKNTYNAEKAQKRLNEAMSEGAVEAQREVGKINQIIRALDNAKLSEEGRMKVLDKFKSEYSTYIDALGIEIKTVKDLKKNYDLLTASIRSATYERVRDKFKEQELEPLIKKAVEEGADLQDYGKNGRALNAVVLHDAEKAVSDFNTAVQSLTAKNLKNFRETYSRELNALGLDPNKVTEQQIKAAAVPQNMQKISNQAIQLGPQSLNEYLANLIDKGEVKSAADAYKDIIKKEFGSGEEWGAVFDEGLNYVIGQRNVNGVTVSTPVSQQTAWGTTETAAFDQGLFDRIEKFVNAYIKVKESGDRIDAAFSPYIRNDIASGAGGTNSGGGGGGNNPYGDYKVTDPYEMWDANALVARKKEMLERVKDLAAGADVQAVLSEDKKFMDDATRKGIKNMRDAIAWYNEERLKITEELKARNLTPSGDWLTPSSGGSGGRKSKQPMSDAALAELDRYYAERKERIEDARIEEGFSEAEYNKRIEALEQEHLQKRSDLRRSFTEKEDKQFVEQYRQWWESVKGLSKVDWESTDAEWLAAGEKEIEQNKLKAQKDLTQMKNIVMKQMNAIADIISKERPFDGITKNLEENLTNLNILFTKAEREGSMENFVQKQTERLNFVLQEAEHAYTLTTDQLMQRMRDAGLNDWADAILSDENAENLKQALMARLQGVYDQIQEAIKKEASLIKKHVDIQWNDVLFDGKSAKGMYESLLSRLGLQEDAVKRANSLIGVGYASEKVADKLAIKQMQIKLRMQEQYFLLIRKTGMERIAQLEAAGKHEDAEHVRKSMNLALTQEQKTLDEQRVALANKLEENQNRLYTELKSWAELLTSSLQSVFEASNTGNAEFYNERAKLQLTGGSGKTEQYIVIDNAGTSDAKAHYETLTELEALERQHEIEQQNAMADAWKKVMDDINAKLNETITDQLNAMLQNQSVDMNTDAVTKNTEALLGLTATMQGQGSDSIASGLGSGLNVEPGSESGGGNTETQGVPLPVDNGEDAAYNHYVAYMTASEDAKDAILDNQKTILKGEQETNKKMTASAQSMYAKMTAAMNLYGIAYQAMSNDNLSTAQKFEMIAVQAAGQAAIAALSASMSQSVGQVAAETPAVASKAWSQLGPIGGAAAVAVFTALIGGLIGFATSKIAKSKSEIAAATGAGGNSVASGRLVTGMLTYAEGNVNEFTDPSTLTPGRQYNVDAADGRTYRARYMGKNPRTHITNGPEFHLAGERGREAIIDAATTRHIQMDEVGIWRAIQTLSAGGRIGPRKIPGRGIAAFADGNLDELGDMGAMGGIGTMGGIDLVAVQASLDRNSAIQEALLERLSQPIQAKFDVYGKGGLVDSYDTGKKTAQRYGQRY